MGRRYFVFAAMVLATLTTGFFGAVAQAQQSNTSTSGNGLRLSPVRYDINVEAGKSQTIEVNVENITDSATELRAIVNDFTAGDDESGKPKVLFDEKDYAPTHGLRRYVAPIENVKLQAKEKKVVKIQISMPSGVAGGGYYGAVRFLPTATNTDKNVSLSASVGSLLLVTVPGDIKEQLGIAGITVNRGNGKASAFFTNGKDLQTNIRFQNSGNVQVSPFGKVSLKKSGTEIAS